MAILDLSYFILSRTPQQSTFSQPLATYQAMAKVEWLFPQELEVLRDLDQGLYDWPETVRLLK